MGLNDNDDYADIWENYEYEYDIHSLLHEYVFDKHFELTPKKIEAFRAAIPDIMSDSTLFKEFLYVGDN